ncbi:MAG: ROK family protein [Bacteroidota bacterium]
MQASELLWGIDLGGTKIEGAVIHLRDELKVLARTRIPTQRDRGYDHILNQIALLISMLQQETGLKPKRVGLAMPGTIDPLTNRVKNSNTTCLNDRFFAQDLEKKLGIPIRHSNDANCFAIAEAKLGIVPQELRDAQIVFGVILGTGTGGGLVINGQVLKGRQGIAGEWGHNFLDDSGGDCYCGRRGCVETILSGTGLENYYQSISGVRLSMKEIMQRLEEDEGARQTLNRFHHFFGRAISQVINIVDPDAIVIGGGLGNIDSLYTEGVAQVKKYVFNPRLDTLFLKPKLGDSAGVFGAALL